LNHASSSSVFVVGGKTLITVHDVSVDLNNPSDPFGQVTGGMLNLTGLLRFADFVLEAWKKSSSFSSTIIYRDENWHEWEEIQFNLDQNLHDCLPGQLFCLNIIEHGDIWGLILRTTEQNNVFFRIGLFRTMLGNNAFVKKQPRTTSSNGTGSSESENQSAY
jgi:hypothetical protein